MDNNPFKVFLTPIYSSPTSSGGGVNGSFNHFSSSFFVNVFNLSDTTRLASPHLYFAMCFSQQSSSIADKAVHICVSTALRDVPMKLIIFNSCLIFLKNFSRPSCLVELRYSGSSQLEVVGEQLYHIAMFVIPDSYAPERFGVFFLCLLTCQLNNLVDEHILRPRFGQ